MRTARLALGVTYICLGIVNIALALALEGTVRYIYGFTALVWMLAAGVMLTVHYLDS